MVRGLGLLGRRGGVAFYADLHIHSKHSRATSRDCELENLAWWAGRKGVAVLGTGDFTHPEWFAELRSKLVADGDSGLFQLRDDLERERLRRLPRSCRTPVRFMLSVEVSTIHERNDRTRKIHHLVYAPDLETVGRINTKLARVGNLASDGHPILRLDSRDLLEVVLESGSGAYIVPAHVWNPWFSALGAMSGFDHIDECYRDLAPHVFAVETGLSSDPAMSWRVSALDRYRLVSNSDAHSPPMIGREASVFHCAPDYFEMRRALETGSDFGGTVELFPEEGKYHLDGHRACGVRLDPSETRTHGGNCPSCDQPVTLGVLNRVHTVADRSENVPPETAAPFQTFVPLSEILGEIENRSPRSRAVAQEVDGLVARLGPELQILGEVLPEDLRRQGSDLVAEAVQRLRRGAIRREPGYDGEPGRIRMFGRGELAGRVVVAPLFDAPIETLPPPPPATPAAPPTPLAPRRPRRTRMEGATALAGLDPDQLVAVMQMEGPLAVVGGPGSGKTRTCVHRVAHLIQSGCAAAEECLTISDGRRSAHEASERLAHLLPDQRQPHVTTFHGLGLRILREQRTSIGLHPRFRVADAEERLSLVRDLFGLPPHRAQKLLAEISLLKRTQISGPRTNSRAPSTEASLLLEHYDEALADRHVIDFDDLLAFPVRLLESNRLLRETYRARYRWVSVDDAQDVDPLQYRLLRTLADGASNVCVFGDPNQAICSFRGADARFFVEFPSDYPSTTTVELRRNHRSNARIAEVARSVIAPAASNPAGAPSESPQSTRPKEEEPPAHPRIVVHRAGSERAEADFVARAIARLLAGGHEGTAGNAPSAPPHDDAPLRFADCAVLFRTGAHAETLRRALDRAGIPFQHRSHRPLLDRPAVRFIADRLRAPGERRRDPGAPALPFAGTVRAQIDLVARETAVADELRLERTGDPQTPAPSAAEVRVAADLLGPWAERFGEDRETFLSELTLSAESDTFDPAADRVALLTLHAAKGLEFKAVFLVGCEDGLLPLHDDDPVFADHREERRLFFFGLSRAKHHLFLTWARRRRAHGRIRADAPSPYLGEIAPEHRTTYRPRRSPAAPTRKRPAQLALL